MKNFTIMLSLIILPSSATAKPLFEDNFDSGIMSPDWIPVNGNAWVHSGWLHVQDTAGGDRGSVVVVHNGDTAWTNYELSVTADPIPTTKDNWDFADLYFRLSMQSREVYEGYTLHMHGDSFSDEPGFIYLNRRNGSGSSTNLAKADASIGSGPADVFIKVTGPQIQVSVDGNRVLDVVDPAPVLHGGIGVGCGWEAEARFDNVVVTPEPATLAGFRTIPFDYNVSTQDRNTGFPVGDVCLASVYVNGVPGQSVPFSIPAPGHNEWTGPGQHHMASPDDSGWYTLDIPVHLSGVRSVVTLANQHWWAGDPATLEFIDAAGRIRHTELLVPKRDIRDFNTGTGGRIDPNCAQEVVRVSPGVFNSPDVMDMQAHELPEFFWAEGNELATIRVTDHAEWMTHQLIVSGVTVSGDLVQIPEPATLGMLALGVLMALIRRRQRHVLG